MRLFTGTAVDGPAAGQTWSADRHWDGRIPGNEDGHYAYQPDAWHWVLGLETSVQPVDVRPYSSARHGYHGWSVSRRHELINGKWVSFPD